MLHPLRLKHKKHRAARNYQANLVSDRPQPKPGTTSSSRKRLWLLRLSALVLIPIFTLGGLEVALRLTGYGYSSRFFERAQIGGRPFFVPNAKFGYRFFPRALVRNPLPLRMAAQKGPHTYRIFLLGESAAQGDPDPTFGFGRYLETLLRNRHPGTDFEVVCVAMTAIDSHVILPIARECARHDGDLWLVYMGNNEMVGPFGAGTVFGKRTPALAFIRASIALKATRTGQLLEACAARLSAQSSTNKSWGGMKMFLDHQLRYDDPSRLRAYQYFGDNLDDILGTARSAGVPVLLSTVGSNLRSFAPFSSLHRSDLGDEDKAAWTVDFQIGNSNQNAGNFPEALQAYSNALAIDPQYAELHFQMGRCFLAQSNDVAAREQFQLARDDDTLAFRADTRINGVIRKAAARHADDGVHLVDAVHALEAASPAGIPGPEFFYEHVHLNFAGNYLLARAFADQIEPLLPSSIQSHDRGAWASADSCNRALAATSWDQYRVWNVSLRRLFEPPFIGQSDHAAQINAYQAKLNEIANLMNTSETPELARQTYDQAVAAAPDDYFLRSNFSQFLEAIGDLGGALKEQQRVSELLPQTPVPYFRIGKLFVRLGQTAEAAKSFSRALSLQPDFVQSLNESGLLLANESKNAEAVQCFQRAAQSDPNFAETYLNWGFVEQADGNLDDAVKHYAQAARLEEEGPAAYFAQGVSLAIQHKRPEAIESFRHAIQLKPGFWQANYLLGTELAAQDNVPEAQAQFAEVIKYRPDYARAHLNLGVALAKQGKLDPALAEFQKCLKLNPTNALALKHIETIERLKQRTF